MRKLWKNYNLSVVLFVLFVGSWIAQTFTGWVEYRSERQAEGQPAHILGNDGYVWRWSQATFENWQSEFLQLFSMVVLTALLIHKGSAESRDSNDKMQQSLDRLERQMRELSAAAAR